MMLLHMLVKWIGFRCCYIVDMIWIILIGRSFKRDGLNEIHIVR